MVACKVLGAEQMLSVPWESEGGQAWRPHPGGEPRVTSALGPWAAVHLSTGLLRGPGLPAPRRTPKGRRRRR